MAEFEARAATTVTDGLAGIEAGAVYTPLLEMEPPPVTLQFTAVCAEPVTVSVNVAVPPSSMVGVAPLRLVVATESEGEAIVSLNDADPLPGFWTRSDRLPLAVAETGT